MAFDVFCLEQALVSSEFFFQQGSIRKGSIQQREVKPGHLSDSCAFAVKFNALR